MSLRDIGHIQLGQKILVNGAAGGVGTFGIQIAKAFGAHVTGICSTRNLEMVLSIGADRVIDYTRQNFTEDAAQYDLILDAVGNHSLSALKRVLTPNGICVKFVGVLAKISKVNLTVLGDLLHAGKIIPVIDRRYPLNQVPEAIRYLEAGHARGKVIIVPGVS
jgi:NADPH:quinone reductase-like Zn-dependent oxidoreductase